MFVADDTIYDRSSQWTAKIPLDVCLVHSNIYGLGPVECVVHDKTNNGFLWGIPLKLA